MKAIIGMAGLGLVLVACLPGMLSPEAQQDAMANAQADANAQLDAAMAERVEKARAAARQGGPREAIIFAQELQSAYQAGCVARGKIDGAALLPEARAVLASAAEATPAEKPVLLAAEGTLLLAAAKPEEAEKALRASMAAAPNLAALLALVTYLDDKGERDEIASLCKETLAVVDTDDERYEVLLASVTYSHAASIDGGLAWASDADRAFFKEEKARRDAQTAAENEAHRQEQQQQQAQMQADFKASAEKAEAENKCKERCEADASTCDSQCGGDPSCRNSCSDAADHCYGSC